MEMDSGFKLVRKTLTGYPIEASTGPHFPSFFLPQSAPDCLELHYGRVLTAGFHLTIGYEAADLQGYSPQPYYDNTLRSWPTDSHRSQASTTRTTIAPLPHIEREDLDHVYEAGAA